MTVYEGFATLEHFLQLCVLLLKLGVLVAFPGGNCKLSILVVDILFGYCVDIHKYISCSDIMKHVALLAAMPIFLKMEKC